MGFISRFLLFLGPARSRALFLVIGGTGLLSLILNAIPEAGDWVRSVQTLLALAALVGAAIIIGGRMEAYERGRWLGILLPSLGALLLGLTVLPQYLLPLAGGALGWVFAGLFIFRARAPMAYQRAVKLLRKNQYAEAVKELDALIKQEPQTAEHYGFRAQIMRVWGKLDRARRDYQKMAELAPSSPVPFNALAEVNLQTGDYGAARAAAQQAATLAPQDWVAHYNLGMIEDRLAHSPQVITHLQAALALKVRDVRHRALMHFYLLRAHARMGQLAAAQQSLAALRQAAAGLDEWEKILQSDQAATLAQVLGEDIAAARKVTEGEIDITTLIREQVRG
jgi:tetratricopeptide (TPR) repeat protein